MSDRPDHSTRPGPRPGRAAAALRRTLVRQARSAPAPADVDAVVELVPDDARPVTTKLSGGRMQVVPGRVEQPTVRVMGSEEVLAAVAEGTRSGVEAFLKGEIRVRGNLGLALRLDSMFRPSDRPVRWPSWGEVRAGRVLTRYLEAGAGPPVLLLHGLGATNASFLPTMWELARDHRVIAPDLPGFGDSAKPLRSYHARFFAGWARDLMDALGLDRAHVVGNSMGGRIGIELGLEAPDRVDRLALLAPAPAFIHHRQFVRLVRVLRPELAMLPVPLSHRMVVRNMRWMFSVPDRLPPAWFDAGADEFLRVFSSPGGRIAFFSAARQIYLEEPYGEDGFWERLPALTRPALFVWGQRDHLVPARFARHVEAALPAARSVVLADCGHVPQFELPKKTNRLVREFLDAG